MEEQFKRACHAAGVPFDFWKHPYFDWMRRTSRLEFARSQAPFLHAVEEFPCALAACLSKLGKLELRTELAENIACEHGNGQISRTHKQTFLTYLAALGVPEGELDHIPVPIGVKAFTENVRNFCLAHSGAAGAALLGMIESLYSGVSAQIASHIHAEGWVVPGSQSHYTVHAELDVEHADELLKIAYREWLIPSRRSEIETALALGGHALWQIYASLLPPSEVRQRSDETISSVALNRQ